MITGTVVDADPGRVTTPTSIVAQSRTLRFAFTLPWPPTNNNMFVNARLGGRYLSKKGRAYATRIAELALMGHIPRFKLQGRLGISLIAHPPDRGRHDLDNLWKGILDALTKCGCVPDDADFDFESIARASVVAGGRIEVEIWQLTGTGCG